MSNLATTQDHETTIALRNELGWVSPALFAAQKDLIVQATKEYLLEGADFGTIKGAGDRKVLFKSGAEKLAYIFGLRPDLKSCTTELGNGHREVMSTCTLYNQAGEQMVSCSGLATTMESKHRYRRDANFEVLEDDIPKDYQSNKQKYTRQGYGAKKVDGAWRWVRFGSAGRSENPDIADTYNTVLKMAEKRALVAAVLMATSASAMFTQDLEDEAPEAHTASVTSYDEPADEPLASKIAVEEITIILDRLKTPKDTIEQIKEAFGVKSFSELTANEAHKVLLNLRKKEREKNEQDKAADAAAVEESAEDIPFA